MHRDSKMEVTHTTSPPQERDPMSASFSGWDPLIHYHQSKAGTSDIGTDGLNTKNMLMQELIETKREIHNHFYKQRLHNLRHRIRFVTDEGTEDEKGCVEIERPAPLPMRSPQVQSRH